LVTIIKCVAICIYCAWTLLRLARHTFTQRADTVAIASNTIIAWRTTTEMGTRTQPVLATHVFGAAISVITGDRGPGTDALVTAVRVGAHISIVTRSKLCRVRLFACPRLRVANAY